MISDSAVEKIIQYAYSEIEKFGLPTKMHLDISIEKAKEIAAALKVEPRLVIAGVCLMDIKLGEAFKTNRLSEHIEMGKEASLEFLKQFNLEENELSKIINSVEAHHGTIPFGSIEAEIVANADCYRFIHPKGVIHYIGTLTKRNLDFPKIIEGAEAKLEEKRKILSLEYCKKELEPSYQMFKKIFADAKK